MAILNEKNSITEKIIHLMITEKCNRKCPHCCNNQYNLKDIPFVTKEELSNCNKVFLTGGEPFAYADPCKIAKDLKDKYPNIKEIIVYTNALELVEYFRAGNKLHDIDGLTISLKNRKDEFEFQYNLRDRKDINSLKSNWVYIFPYKGWTTVPISNTNFMIFMREWQKEFVPAPDSIFRRMY